MVNQQNDLTPVTTALIERLQRSKLNNLSDTHGLTIKSVHDGDHLWIKFTDGTFIQIDASEGAYVFGGSIREYELGDFLGAGLITKAEYDASVKERRDAADARHRDAEYRTFLALRAKFEPDQNQNSHVPN